MYAIIRTGGKQYKVKPGDVLRVEKLSQNLGDEFDITEVLMVAGEKNFVGAPLVDNAKVTLVVTNQSKAPKIIVFKKKRRQGYRRTQGHRQPYTEVFVKSITSPEGTAKSDAEAKVFDPQEAEAKKQKKLADRKEAKKSPTKSAKKKVTKKKATKKKKVVKKKAATKKKAAAKKTTTKKKTAAKKTAAKKKKS